MDIHCSDDVNVCGEYGNCVLFDVSGFCSYYMDCSEEDISALDEFSAGFNECECFGGHFCEFSPWGPYAKDQLHGYEEYLLGNATGEEYDFRSAYHQLFWKVFLPEFSAEAERGTNEEL